MDNRQTRRSVIRTSFGLVAGTAASIVASRAQAQDQKIAKNLVQYQETPKDGAVCSKCVNWVAPNGCKIVEGTINPQGWCVAFAPQEG